jgi:hypothetical protein
MRDLKWQFIRDILWIPIAWLSLITLWDLCHKSEWESYDAFVFWEGFQCAGWNSFTWMVEVKKVLSQKKRETHNPWDPTTCGTGTNEE